LKTTNYHLLHFQDTGEFARVDELLVPWIKRYKRTGLVREIQHRQTLLRYAENPKATLDYLKRELGLPFNHTKQELNQKPNFPYGVFNRPTRKHRYSSTR
jgi:hypothetical protein